MDKAKRIILCDLPTSICNLRCKYCYLTHQGGGYEGKQANIRYSPSYIAKAFSKERLGGVCYFNFCAKGETLLTKDIDKYIYEIIKEGHYVEIITNMTVTPVIDKILSWDKDLLERLTFKCSFHYLQLLEKNLLNIFAENVNKAWESGCSANVEITPDDELIPYIDDVKQFSMEHFGALPHLTIARDDSNGHDFLTSLSIEDYKNTWSQFKSEFWDFKMGIFNQKREEYCYAGAWSLYLNFETGYANRCYLSGRYTQNVYDDITKPIEFFPVGKCRDTHCYNGHVFLTFGCIAGFTDVGYGDIRDREKIDGTHWIRPQMKAFLNSKLEDSNDEFTEKEKRKNERKVYIAGYKNRAKYFLKRHLKK